MERGGGPVARDGGRPRRHERRAHAPDVADGFVSDRVDTAKDAMKASGAEAVADLAGRHPQRGQLAAVDDAVLPPREVARRDINAATPGFDGLRAALWSLYDINADSGAGEDRGVLR